MDWLSRLPLPELIPDEYEPIRAVLPEALLTFVGALPTHRVAEIMAAQSRLGLDTTAAHRLTALARRCPALHKLGQTLARDHRLTPAFRASLQTLESLPVEEPRPDVAAAIRAELSSHHPAAILERLHVEPVPIAEASIAFVVPFSLHGRPGEKDVDGVFKALKPGVDERLREDFSACDRVGKFLDEAAAQGRVPDLDYRGTLADIRDHLLRELDLSVEQSNLCEAAAQFAGLRDVLAPTPLPLGTPRLTAMTRVRGALLGAAPGRISEDQAHALARALVAGPMFSETESALFHADPHAGNLLLQPDGRIAILDWSLVGRLARDSRRSLVRLLLAAWLRRSKDVIGSMEDLAGRAVPPEAQRAIHEALTDLPRGTPPSLRWVVDLFDRVVVAGVRLAPELLLFRKALLTLDGVWSDVRPGFTPDFAILQAGWWEVVREWPARLSKDWFAPDHRTHLATSELVEAWMRLPMFAMDYWTSVWTGRA